MRAASIRADVVAPHDVAPAIDLADEEFLERLRSARGEIHAEGLGELLAQVRLVEHLGQLGVKLVEDLLGSSGRRADAPPGRSSTSFTPRDRKSTRLNSSHRCISYAVFCLKKKKQRPHKKTNK